MTVPGTKVRAEHVSRRACVYVRQSTVFQVAHHRESTERQYQLRQRAIELGWAPAAIDIIDEDQGVNGHQNRATSGQQN
jgi:DNA invertase Pin-like site-specific DNA recombinase